MEKKYNNIIGLIGNPNVGKSTLFNVLTGAHQHVGNWPGKTVEKKEGTIDYKDKKIKIVDLPGLYSLNAYAEEEKIACDFILKDKPQAVVQIIDAQNLTRNLYLTLQLIEIGAPVVVALNMLDLASQQGIKIDIQALSTLLGVSVVKIDAKKKTGLDNLLDKILNYKKQPSKFTYDLKNKKASIRYAFINDLIKDVLIQDKKEIKKGLSDSFDNLVTNKYFGIPLFLLIILAVFQIIFKIAQPIINIIELSFEFLGIKIIDFLALWPAIPNWINSLLVDGIIGGVGGILVFIPIIAVLFFILGILEDSGYMARVAFVMDKFMHKLGLHGKAFLPLVLGFGCNVPAIMATRILEDKKDRLLVILMSPFISCGARLPIYVLFTALFFSAYQGWIIFSLYLLSIIIAVSMGLLFKKVLFKKLSTPFVIELPPYRWPALKNVLMYVWFNLWFFIKKAGTIILFFSVIVWLLASFPFGVEYGSLESLAGRIGQVIAPIFAPLGFGNWQSAVALLFGFGAKEVVVSTFGALTSDLTTLFTPLSAYAFMVFILLYMPCLAVLAVVKQETKSWRWPLFMVGYTTTVAWIASFIIYQGGRLLGLG